MEVVNGIVLGKDFEFSSFLITYEKIIPMWWIKIHLPVELISRKDIIKSWPLCTTRNMMSSW